jgi:hypothetical protein
LGTIESLLSVIDTNSFSQAIDDRVAFVTVFGDQIAERREDMINVAFNYGIPQNGVTTTTSGGTVTASNSMAVISSGAGASGSAQLQTQRRLRYRTGRETYCYFTALFTGTSANSTQWIGCYDSNDGAAIGYNGTAFSVLFRQNGVDTATPQSSFNLDKLNGTGPSGFNINPANINVFRIAWGWLGAAPILYQILDQNSQWITFHQIIWNNLHTTPHFINPILPITAAVNWTAASTVSLSTASWSGGSVETASQSSQRYFSAANSTPTTIAAAIAQTPLLIIQNNTTYNGYPNHTEARLVVVTGGQVSTSFQTCMLRIRKNATLSGTSFTSVNANSVMSYSTTGTTTGGTEIFDIPVCTYCYGPTVNLLPPDGFEIIMQPGDNLVLTAMSFSGSGTTAVGSMAWEERF